MSAGDGQRGGAKGQGGETAIPLGTQIAVYVRRAQDLGRDGDG